MTTTTTQYAHAVLTITPHGVRYALRVPGIPTPLVEGERPDTTSAIRAMQAIWHEPFTFETFEITKIDEVRE